MLPDGTRTFRRCLVFLVAFAVGISFLNNGVEAKKKAGKGMQ
jgi:hypothetical protein